MEKVVSLLILLKDVLPDIVNHRDSWKPGPSSDLTLSWKANINVAILLTNMKVVRDFFFLKIDLSQAKDGLTETSPFTNQFYKIINYYYIIFPLKEEYLNIPI